MKLIKLKDKWVKKTPHKEWFYSDNYISNSHFVIKKTIVDTPAKYCYGEKEKQPNLDNIIPEGDGVPIIKTPFLYKVDGILSRVFKDDSGNYYLFNNEYLESLFEDITSFYLHDNCLLADYYKNVCVMKLKNDPREDIMNLKL